MCYCNFHSISNDNYNKAGLTTHLSYQGVLCYQPHGASTSNATVYQSIRGGSHSLAEGVTVGQGILLEAALTFILVIVVLLVATDRTWHHRQLALAVGFTVFVDIAAS